MQRFNPGSARLLEDVLDESGDDGLVALEQLGHLPERQTGRLAIEANLDARLAVLGLVEEELGFASGELGHRAGELGPTLASRDATLAMKSCVPDSTDAYITRAAVVESRRC